MKSLPSPVPSPSYDAPSPGNTPPLEEIDNTEAVDMELDDDDNAAPDNILGKLAFVLNWEFIFTVYCFYVLASELVEPSVQCFLVYVWSVFI